MGNAIVQSATIQLKDQGGGVFGSAPAIVAPLAPTNFTAPYISDTSLGPAWTNNDAGNTDNFELDISPNGVDTWTPLADPAGNAVSAVSSGLTVDTQYFYRLRAVNASGGSSYATANGTTTVSAFVDGSPFVITGSGFGVKATAAPIKFDTFKSYASGTLLEANDASWVHYTGSGATDGALISDVNPRYVGSKSAYNDMSRNGFDTNYHTFGATDKVFLSYWYATNDAVYGGGASGTEWVGKLCRITSTAASGGGGVYNGRGVHQLSNQDPSTNLPPAINWNPGPGVGDFERTAYLNLTGNNDWVRIDMWIELSTIDVSNGVVNAKSWGAEEEFYSGIPNRTTVGGNYQLDNVILGVMTANETSPTNAGMKNTDVYIDITQMRVELCDNANYALTSAPEIQPATAWADGEITITANKGRYTTGTYYLHVLNDAGVSVANQEVIL